MNLSDEDIVEGILAGGKELFAVLVERYQRPVYNLMFRYAGNGEEAADLTQEVFIRSFDRLKSFRAGNSFFPWLYSLAVNRANDWSRGRTRSRVGLDAYGDHLRQEGSADQLSRLERRETGRIIDQALARMPDEIRELLIFRYRHERSIKEAALVFNLSESAVKMRIKRGLDELQEELQRMGFYESQSV